jgi:hypothetical protein
MRQPEDALRAPAPGAASNVRLALLVLEGYAYLLLIIAVFTALVLWLTWGVVTFRPFVALLALFIGVPLAITTCVAIRSLFFRLPDPDAVVVSKHHAPALHAMVEEVRRQLRAPAVDAIRVNAWFNASALQLPRAAAFWPPEHLGARVPAVRDAGAGPAARRCRARARSHVASARPVRGLGLSNAPHLDATDALAWRTRGDAGTGPLAAPMVCAQTACALDGHRSTARGPG